MSTALALALLLAGTALVAALAVYAVLQWRQVAARRAQQAAAQQARAARTQDLRLSLQVLAQAMLDGQVDLSEGALRVHTLLQGFALDCDSRHRFHAFSELAAALADQPLGAARQALPAAERRRLERARLALEDAHRAAVLDAARALLAQLRAS